MAVCINGHEWAKRQATKDEVTFTALDNGFATVEDPVALQAICDRLGPAQIQALLDKWLAILPGAFTEADHDAGYRYELSILQESGANRGRQVRRLEPGVLRTADLRHHRRSHRSHRSPSTRPGVPPTFRTPDPIRSGPERRG